MWFKDLQLKGKKNRMNFYSHFFVASPQRYKRVTSPGVQLGILKARGGYPNLLFFLSGFFFHEH